MDIEDFDPFILKTGFDLWSVFISKFSDFVLKFVYCHHNFTGNWNRDYVLKLTLSSDQIQGFINGNSEII